ncbi:hypothetical protein P3W85_08975 [Cupriavidus basilensis]|uniref:Uncharacterized protein n=1 Tax=Cupriavidus basilensis TaxID=68895 RepID=A0ABT6AKF9_9BURK|nr:hypothetical protein [Cupriavidus basilensis]MDF3833080.1 hypothetical protein [Cupriavidus basilensis]
MSLKSRRPLLKLALGASLCLALTAGAAGVGEIGQPAPHIAFETLDYRDELLNRDPALTEAVLAFFGLETGTYFWEDDLVASQAWDGLGQRRSNQVVQLPDGRVLLASMRTLSTGEERTALLADAQGNLQAVALAHLQCGKKCLPHEQRRLTVFLRAGVGQASAEPLVAWGRRDPDPEADAGAPRPVQVEFRTVDPGSAERAAPPAVPAGMPGKVPLYPYSRRARDDNNQRGQAVFLTPHSVAQVAAYYRKLAQSDRQVRWNDGGEAGGVLWFKRGKGEGIVEVSPQRNDPLTRVRIEYSPVAP